jgi:anti-anti-sigma regulatory factor
VECWIDHLDDADSRVVKLAGRLGFEQVPDLLRVCDGREGRKLVLDLEDLLTTDSAGAQTLRRLRRDGASFRHLSEYLRLKLNLE